MVRSRRGRKTITVKKEDEDVDNVDE